MKVFYNFISILVITAFISESAMVYAVPTAKPQQASVSVSQIADYDNIKAVNLSDFYIPSSYGTIKWPCGNKSNPKVILISDVHCNYEAQHNIANILKILVNRYGINLVAVEGAKDIVDVSRFSGCPDEGLKNKVIDKFVREGYVTGPEFLKIVKDKKLPFTIYGVEDTAIYKENFNLLKDCLKKLKKGANSISALKNHIRELKKQTYSAELKYFDKKTLDYKENRMGITDYAQYLYKNQKPVTSNQKNFILLIKCIDLEKKIDLKKADKEREDLIKQLERILVREDAQKLVRKSLEFRLGKISDLSFYRYLAEITDLRNFRELFTYLRLLKLYSKIDTDILIDEIDRIQSIVYRRLTQNETQRKLIKVSADADILDKLIRLKMNPSEWAYYRKEFDIGLIKEFGDTPGDLQIDACGRFYNAALKRNSIMIENLLNKIQNKGVAALITGGFHTEGISKILEDKGIPYVIIRPNITKADDNDTYFSIVRIISENNLALPTCADPENAVTTAVNAGAIAREVGDRIIGELGQGKKEEAGLPARISYEARIIKTAWEKLSKEGFTEINPVKLSPKIACFDWDGVMSLIWEEEKRANIEKLLKYLTDNGTDIFIITSGNVDERWNAIRLFEFDAYIKKENIVWADPSERRSAVLKKIAAEKGLLNLKNELVHFDDDSGEIDEIRNIAVTVGVVEPSLENFVQMIDAKPNYISVGFRNPNKIIQCLGSGAIRKEEKAQKIKQIAKKPLTDAEYFEEIWGRVEDIRKHSKKTFSEILRDRIILITIKISLLRSIAVRILSDFSDSPKLRERFWFCLPLIKWLSGKFLIPTSDDLKVAAKEAEKAIIEKREHNIGITLDSVGDAADSEEDARAHVTHYLNMIEHLGEKTKEWPKNDSLDNLSKLHFSVKISAVVYDAWKKENGEFVNRDKIKFILKDIIKKAAEFNAFIRIDAEEYEYRDFTVHIYTQVVEELAKEGRDLIIADQHGTLRTGIVIQAYLKDSGKVLDELYKWAKKNGCRLPVRLVKGTYDDEEKILANEGGYNSPVFDNKESTDAHFELLTEFLIRHPENFKTAIASHNIRSIAHAIALAKSYGIAGNELEVQMLYGMGNPIQNAIAEMGYPVRAYVPVGSFIKGMKYSGRRLKELANKSNALTRTMACDYKFLKKLSKPPLFQKDDNPTFIAEELNQIYQSMCASNNIPQEIKGAEQTKQVYSEMEKGVRIALERYSNVHRGSGQHSIISTGLFDAAREIALEYFGLDRNKPPHQRFWWGGKYIVIFGDSKGLKTLKAQIKGKGDCRAIWSKDIGLPLGLGILAVRKDALPKGIPFRTGGGTVKLVSKNYVIWADSPDRFEAGTPNIAGVIAFAKALKMMGYYKDRNIFKKKTAKTAVEEILYKDELRRISGKELLSEIDKTLIGRGAIVPTEEGGKLYINFDNGASTPTFTPIWETVCKTLEQPEEMFADIINEVRNICASFFSAPLDNYDIIFTSNTTDGINIAANGLGDIAKGGEEALILNTLLEHNSNELPWRYIPNTHMERLPVDNDGFIDLAQMEQVLNDYNINNKYGSKRIRLIAVSGASNVLGSLNDINEISRIAHKYGAKILVDAAQLAAHRRINIFQTDIDFLVFSGHKMYAPFGAGGLIARKGLLGYSEKKIEEIKSSGNDNVAGIAAMGKAMILLKRIGMEVIEKEERRLTVRLLNGLSRIPGIEIFGVSDSNSKRIEDRAGVVSFAVKGMPHNLVAKLLAETGGIGVRNGCFCTHLLVKSVLKINFIRNFFFNILYILAPKLSRAMFPGLVRVSIGIENTEDEVDSFLETLEKAAAKRGTLINRIFAYFYFGTPLLPHTDTEKKTERLAEEIAGEVYSADETSDGVEIINHLLPREDKPVAAIFDVHGTLIQPTWKEEYRRVYKELTGKEPSANWIEENIIHKDDDYIINALSRISGKSEDAVTKKIGWVRNIIREKEAPRPMPGALEFIKALYLRGVPIVIVSGSERELILKQLKETGFLEYIPEENIIGIYSDNRQHYERAKVIEAIRIHYPRHTLAYFDDWIDGIEEIKKSGGICFGIPQGEGKEFEGNRSRLAEAGADYILRDWSRWEELDRLLTIPSDVQLQDEKIPVAGDSAKKLAVVLPAPRHKHIGLFIDISDDLKRITYSIVEDDSEVFKGNGAVNYNALKFRELVSLPSSFLVTPQRYVENRLPSEVKQTLLQLLNQGRRYTRYRNIITSWDVSEDKDVWTTNIDTVFMHKRMEELGIFNNANIKSVIEIGVGGGHISGVISARISNLKQITVTDISIYALRTAKRCIGAYMKKGVKLLTYWGKGIKTVEDKADLIIVNPPYIPTPPFAENKEGDPYRGTGLIREILEVGVNKLNHDNPNACILINVSSMAKKDFEEYLKEFGHQFAIEPVGEPLKVPLKIKGVKDEWVSWLLKEGGIEFIPNAKPYEEPYWHTIQVYRITPKKERENRGKPFGLTGNPLPEYSRLAFTAGKRIIDKDKQIVVLNTRNHKTAVLRVVRGEDLTISQRKEFSEEIFTWSKIYKEESLWLDNSSDRISKGKQLENIYFSVSDDGKLQGYLNISGDMLGEIAIHPHNVKGIRYKGVGHELTAFAFRKILAEHNKIYIHKPNKRLTQILKIHESKDEKVLLPKIKAEEFLNAQERKVKELFIERISLGKDEELITAEGICVNTVLGKELLGLVRESIKYFEEASRGRPLGEHLKNLLTSPQNSEFGAVLLKIAESDPVRPKRKLGRNSARYYLKDSGEKVIALDKKFIRILIKYKKEFPEAVKWLLIERLMHELCHDNKKKDIQEVILEETNIILSNDRRLYKDFVYNTELGKKIERLWHTMTEGERLIMQSKAFFEMLKKIVKAEEKKTKEGMRHFMILQFLHTEFVKPFVEKFYRGTDYAKGFPAGSGYQDCFPSLSAIICDRREVDVSV